MRKYGALIASSENPEKLGDTVKGGILALSTVIIFVANLAGIEIGTQEITNFAVGAGAAVSSIWFTYGLVKKFVIFMDAKYREAKGQIGIE